MIKKYFILILVFFILFTVAAVNGADCNSTLNNSTLTSTDNQSVVETANNIEKPSYNIQTHNLVKYHKNDSQFEFKIVDNKNNPVKGVKVAIKIDGKTYSRTTNNAGKGLLKINLKPGKYTITTSYQNKSIKNNIKVMPRVTAKDVTSTYGTKTKFSVKVLDNQGNAMKNQLVKFKISGKKYSAYTNLKGIAKITLNLNAGTYSISYTTDGITSRNTYKVKNYYDIRIYKWNSGADVTKNKKIKSNVPNSKLVKKVIKAAKKGTPLIKFKGGKGKVVFITAGVHGSELSSQVAAMNLVKYLENHPIKGTVYIMPFVNPKATAKNIRNYGGVNLNSVANVKGTISNKIVKLVTKHKCNAYGDFHCTKPGGKPGKNVAMGTYKPTAKSATLAKYISKKSKVKYLIYKKAGAEYPGALEDAVSLKGIPAVTCEVISPHGTIARGTPKVSLSMMMSFLKFSSLI